MWGSPLLLHPELQDRYPQTGGRFFPQPLGTQCGSWCGLPPSTWASSGSLGLWQTATCRLTTSFLKLWTWGSTCYPGVTGPLCRPPAPGSVGGSQCHREDWESNLSPCGDLSGKEVQKGGSICMCMADPLFYGRNQHNIGKQLYYNKNLGKIIYKNIKYSRCHESFYVLNL